MYVIVEENQNCSGEERVFNALGEPRLVQAIQTPHPTGGEVWCDVVGVEENGEFSSALGIQVEDSGAGLAWLIRGGLWGIRFKPQTENEPWSLSNPHQWGTAFKVLDSSAADIRFK
jgi:hypothetical protein